MENTCTFCRREINNRGSLASHIKCCKENPNAIKWRRTLEGTTTWNKGLTKETDERLKKSGETFSNKVKDGLIVPAFNNKHHSEESKKLISEKMKGNTNANHRGDRQTYYKEIRMDSSWEKGTAQYLDKNSIVWKYNEKGFKLSTGNYYYPDFFIYDLEGNFLYLIEVKGYFREANKEKFELFKKDYPDIEVKLWNKEELIVRDIITKSGLVK